MKKITMILIAVGLSAAACNSYSLAHDQVIQFKQHKIKVQLADTPQKREVGLSGVANMADDEGMLFLFSSSSRPQFWMKGMRFPIDIIWINDNKIVAVTDNVKPEPDVRDDRLTKYAPPVDVDKVLEVNAGWAIRHDVWVGDTYTVVK